MKWYDGCLVMPRLPDLSRREFQVMFNGWPESTE